MPDRDELLRDISLLDRVAARDSRALAELYDRHSGLLFGLILRIVRERGEAEDVLQEVFVQVWTRAHSYNAVLGSPAGWLIGIARNRAVDRIRSNTVRVRAEEQAAPGPPVETPEARTSLGELQRSVRHALAALPADQRQLIEHAYFGGLTQSELAARFQIPLGTVKTRVRAGLLGLRALLQRSVIEL
ncbi:MAG TPA: sigma-70 family RNA polymerase sigma factor [Vicinamibacterales bacterium]|nr:sigma-70 family RNA polymerase sigma factor [Vicinamibacterales bacterium]